MSGGVGAPFWLALNWLARIFILMRPTIPNSPHQTQQLTDLDSLEWVSLSEEHLRRQYPDILG